MKPILLQLGKHYPPERGGMETHLYHQSTGLLDRFDVRVVVANTRRGTRRDRIDGVDVTRVGMRGRLFGNVVCPTFPLHVHRANPGHGGIVHVHLPNPLAHVSVGLVRPGGPLVVTWHSDILRPARVGRAYERWARGLLKRADRVIVTSPRYADSSRALRPFRDKCVVVPLGVDPRRFEATEAVRARALELRGEMRGPVVLFVGRLTYYKGLDVLLDAVPRIRGTVVVVGDGAERKSLQAGIVTRGLEGRVVLRTGVDDNELVAWYHASKLLVLPSTHRTEAFGIVQLEAMASGVPVISTDLDTGVPWVNQHDRTGLVIPPGDAPALAQAVNRLLDDSGLRRRMGSRGRERVQESFSLEAVTGRAGALFESLIRDRQAPSR